MSLRLRYTVFATGAAGLAALLIWGLAGLPSFGGFDGAYGRLISHVAVPERTATNVVATTTFDYRGFDTLGEEFILFAAAVGVLVLLRIQRGDEDVPAELEEREPTAHSLTVRGVATALVAPMLVLGLYIVSHGVLTPGGGFQGGIILMSAFLLVYLAGAHLRLARTSPIEGMELAEGVGAAGFALIGLGGLVFAADFLENFLPLGRLSYPWSGGMIPLANVAVSIAVMGATLVMLGEMLDQRLLTRKGRS